MKERYTCPHVIPNVLQMWVDKCVIEVYILYNLLKISDEREIYMPTCNT
jgi:hypothetical protein